NNRESVWLLASGDSTGVQLSDSCWHACQWRLHLDCRSRGGDCISRNPVVSTRLLEAATDLATGNKSYLDPVQRTFECATIFNLRLAFANEISTVCDEIWRHVRRRC